MTITTENRAPFVVFDDVHGQTWAWLSRHTAPVGLDQILPARAEVGLTPTTVSIRWDRCDIAPHPLLIWHRDLPPSDRDMIERAVHLARMPMAYGNSPDDHGRDG